MWFPPEKDAKDIVLKLTAPGAPAFAYIVMVYSRLLQRDRLVVLNETFGVCGSNERAPSLRCMKYLCEMHYMDDLKTPPIPKGMSKAEFAVQESLGTLPEVTICEKLIAGLRRKYEDGFHEADIKGIYKWHKITL